jgi:RimJ/RimL family protein N-acetyltransferase
VGLIQISPDCKTNRAFYIGLLIDEKYQKNRYPLEAFISIFDYCFNRLGYRKAIVEIVESHEGLKRIITENGFTYEGRLTQECFMNGAFVDELRYSMFDIEYNNKFKPILEKWKEHERIN